MHHFATVDLARAHFSELDRVYSFPMVASVKVLLRCEKDKKAVKEKGCSGLTVLTVIDDDTEVVNLGDQTKVKKRPCFASDQHRSFAEVDSVANRAVFPCFALNAFEVEYANAHANNHKDVDCVAYHHELIKVLTL